jgi:hypothetical protein
MIARDAPVNDRSPASSRVDEPKAGKTRASAVFGLWMLVAGVPTTVWYAWQGDGTFAALTAGATLVGALLLLETWRAKAGPAHAADSFVEVKPRMVETPDSLASRRRAMPIWLHLMLETACCVVGFFGGGIVGASTFVAVVLAATAAVGPDQLKGPTGDIVRGLFNFVVAAGCLFGGAVLGLKQSQRLFCQYVPARCPRCGGDSHYRTGSPITYHCSACGHVHATIWHVKGYRGRR